MEKIHPHITKVCHDCYFRYDSNPSVTALVTDCDICDVRDAPDDVSLLVLTTGMSRMSVMSMMFAIFMITVIVVMSESMIAQMNFRFLISTMTL
jgi:hypothetical protein